MSAENNVSSQSSSGSQDISFSLELDSFRDLLEDAEDAAHRRGEDELPECEGDDLLDQLIQKSEKDKKREVEREKAEQVLQKFNEKDLNQSQSHDNDKVEEIEKREKDRKKKRIQNFAPGLKVFKKEFLSHFQSEDLDLEVDFEYKGRERLINMGLNESDLDEIFHDSQMFLMYLAPEANSALISGPADFKIICDYLFYKATSSPDNELYKKSLFDLLKNYKYRWRLKDSHVHTAMLNLGFREDLLKNVDYLQLVFSEANKAKVKLPKLQENILNKNCDAQKINYDLIKNFVKLICELSVSSFSSQDKLHKLLITHSILLMSSDVNLMNDSFVHKDVMHFLHFQLNNNYSTQNWRTGLEDLSELFIFIYASEMMNWEKDEVPQFRHFTSLDHHHNMLRRLNFIPPSLRGNQLRKYVAYLQLQEMLDCQSLDAVSKPNANHVMDVLSNNLPVFRALSVHDHYCVFTFIRMIDIIVGNEKGDFERQKFDSLKKVMEVLSPLENLRASSVATSAVVDEKARVGELISQFKSKWTLLKARY